MSTAPPAPATQPTLHGFLAVLPVTAFQRYVELLSYLIRIPSVSIQIMVDGRAHTVVGTGPQGIGATFSLLAENFTTHVVRDGQVVVAPDTRKDPRFREISRVRSQEVLFYAGAPLSTPDGVHLGTLSILDTQPRLLSGYEEQLLVDYARLIVADLESHVARSALRESASAGSISSWEAGSIDARKTLERAPESGEPPLPRRRRAARRWRKRRSFPVTRTTAAQPHVAPNVTPDHRDSPEVSSTEDLWRLAYHDPLTGLPNRLLFDNLLTTAFDTARAQGTLVMVGVIDLDGFKHVNDTYGHAVGDRLLAFVANRLAGVLRKDCALARLSGDEFAVLVTGVEHEVHLNTIALRLIRALSEPFCVEGHRLLVQGSLGVAVFPLDVMDNQSALVRADLAMYHAKRHGLGWSRHAEATLKGHLPPEE